MTLSRHWSPSLQQSDWATQRQTTTCHLFLSARYDIARSWKWTWPYTAFLCIFQSTADIYVMKYSHVPMIKWVIFPAEEKKKVYYKERHQSRAAQWLSIVVKEVKMMTNTYFDTKRNRNMINDSVQRDNTSMLNGLCFVFFLFNKTAAIHNGDKWCKAGNPIL